MKKNLKKVLSAVIALAMAISLVPASFAAKVTLSDVADTASYATAVNTLVALNVINGYEDGTFLPDNKITRAEATKIMVAALNQLDAAEGMKGATQFTDVESKHEWATGYINAGVQNGYINGMGDGTFAPDAEVTYAQMVKMLVSAMNYDNYATYLGGYPTGYLSIAGSEGITDGVNANANDAVTRAQVAQLVYNALNTPIVENTGMTWTSDGKLVPTIKKMDGKGTGDAATNYKSILTEYFDAYYVEGYILETSKAGTLKKDEVKFGIAKTEKYDHDDFGKLTTVAGDTAIQIANRNPYTVLVGDTDAANYQGVYASAIIMEDEYEDRTLISFVPSGKNKSVKVDGGLIDSYDSTNYALEVYASENATKTTTYKLQKNAAGTALDVDVYVNGFLVTAAPSATDIANYVLKDTVGEVELVDTYKTDGYYDAIYVNSYVTAIVSSVITSSNDIIFEDMKTVGNINVTAQLTLDEEENEDLQYKIIYNGEEITLAELQEDDILSIACNVTKTELDQCDDFVIYVSRDVKTGKFTSKDTDEVTATIGGEVYSFVDETAAGVSATLNGMTLTNEYTIYVDAFGRIVTADLNTSAAKYAVVDLLIENTTGAYDGDRIRMFTAEGEMKTLVLESDAVVTIPNAVGSTTVDKIQNRVGATMATRTAIQNRVVTYKVSSSTGYIKELTFLDPDKTTTQTADEFKAASSKLGSIYFSDATKVVDAIEYTELYTANAANVKYSDLEVSSLADLTDGVGYTAYGYNKVNGIHAFVVVTQGESAYNEETRVAVVASSTSEGTDETTGDTIYTVNVQDVNSTEKATALTISEDAKYANTSTYVTTTLKIGDVIVYRNGGDGLVKEVAVLFSTAAQGSSFTALADSVIKGTATTAVPAANASAEWTTSWTANPTTDDPIRVMVGIVADKGDKTMTLVKADSSYQTDLNGTPATGVYEIDLSDDTAVYTYDYSKQAKNRVGKGLTASILATTLADNCYADADKEVINWAEAQSRKNIKLAVVKTLDDEAIDVLFISGDYGKDGTPDSFVVTPDATATVEVPTGATGLGSVAFADLGSYTVADGAITGTATEITTAWTDFSSNVAEQTGYYVPVKFTAAMAGNVTIKKYLNDVQVGSDVVVPLAAGASESVVIFLAGTDKVEVADEIEFVVSASGANTMTYTYTLPTVD